jgi:hypothetical protein
MGLPKGFDGTSSDIRLSGQLSQRIPALQDRLHDCD